jgi:hypothetical protein
MARPGKTPHAVFLWIAHLFLQVQGVLDTAVFVSYPSVQKEYKLLYERYFPSKTEALDSYRGKSEINLSSLTVISERSTSSPMTSDIDCDDEEEDGDEEEGGASHVER